MKPSPEGQDFRLLARGPPFTMDEGAIDLLKLAASIRGAGVAAQQAAGRHERLGAGGLEHNAKS